MDVTFIAAIVAKFRRCNSQRVTSFHEKKKYYLLEIRPSELQAHQLRLSRSWTNHAEAWRKPDDPHSSQSVLRTVQATAFMYSSPCKIVPWRESLLPREFDLDRGDKISCWICVWLEKNAGGSQDFHDPIFFFPIRSIIVCLPNEKNGGAFSEQRDNGPPLLVHLRKTYRVCCCNPHLFSSWIPKWGVGQNMWKPLHLPWS